MGCGWSQKVSVETEDNPSQRGNDSEATENQEDVVVLSSVAEGAVADASVAEGDAGRAKDPEVPEPGEIIMGKTPLPPIGKVGGAPEGPEGPEGPDNMPRPKTTNIKSPRKLPKLIRNPREQQVEGITEEDPGGEGDEEEDDEDDEEEDAGPETNDQGTATSEYALEDDNVGTPIHARNDGNDDDKHGGGGGGRRSGGGDNDDGHEDGDDDDNNNKAASAQASVAASRTGSKMSVKASRVSLKSNQLEPSKPASSRASKATSIQGSKASLSASKASVRSESKAAGNDDHEDDQDVVSPALSRANSSKHSGQGEGGHGEEVAGRADQEDETGDNNQNNADAEDHQPTEGEHAADKEPPAEKLALAADDPVVGMEETPIHNLGAAKNQHSRASSAMPAA